MKICKLYTITTLIFLAPIGMAYATDVRPVVNVTLVNETSEDVTLQSTEHCGGSGSANFDNKTLKPGGSLTGLISVDDLCAQDYGSSNTTINFINPKKETWGEYEFLSSRSGTSDQIWAQLYPSNQNSSQGDTAYWLLGNGPYSCSGAPQCITILMTSCPSSFCPPSRSGHAR
ncbi:MAG: hypothetical protein JSR33_07540 [Proteobacteria bacterium]|nr:hypothetical protein [Pseudomonadota bacterium]